MRFYHLQKSIRDIFIMNLVKKSFRLASTRQLFHSGQMRIKPNDSVDGFTPKPIEERNVSIAMYVGIVKVDQFSAYYQQS